jgi:hypothetical protein
MSQSQENVLGAYASLLQDPGLVAGDHDNLSGKRRKPFKHVVIVPRSRREFRCDRLTARRWEGVLRALRDAPGGLLLIHRDQRPVADPRRRAMAARLGSR